MNDLRQIKKLRWRLRIVMAERNIKTNTELHRRIVAIGVDISSQQLTRIVADRPQRLNLDLLDALVTVLNCSVSDLLRVEEEDVSGSEQLASPLSVTGAGAIKERKRKLEGGRTPQKERMRRLPDANVSNLIGVTVSAFPKPERKK